MKATGRTENLRVYALRLKQSMEKSSHKNLKGLGGKQRNEVTQNAVAISEFLIGLALGARRSGEVLAMMGEIDLPGFDTESMAASLREFDEQVLA